MAGFHRSIGVDIAGSLPIDSTGFPAVSVLGLGGDCYLSVPQSPGNNGNKITTGLTHPLPPLLLCYRCYWHLRQGEEAALLRTAAII